MSGAGGGEAGASIGTGGAGAGEQASAWPMAGQLQVDRSGAHRRTPPAPSPGKSRSPKAVVRGSSSPPQASARPSGTAARGRTPQVRPMGPEGGRQVAKPEELIAPTHGRYHGHA